MAWLGNWVQQHHHKTLDQQQHHGMSSKFKPNIIQKAWYGHVPTTIQTTANSTIKHQPCGFSERYSSITAGF
jgi:hypothetical protein